MSYALRFDFEASDLGTSLIKQVLRSSREEGRRDRQLLGDQEIQVEESNRKHIFDGTQGKNLGRFYMCSSISMASLMSARR